MDILFYIFIIILFGAMIYGVHEVLTLLFPPLLTYLYSISDIAPFALSVVVLFVILMIGLFRNRKD